MTKNRKRLVVVFLAVVVMLLPASSVRATQLLTTTINVPTATFTISKLGALALVINEGVPQSIVVTGRELTGMSVGVNINGKAGLGNVLLSSNLSLLPGTTPLTFDHNGSANFTIAEGMVALTFTGKATTVKDLVMQTRTLSSSGDFVITNATGEFADRLGVTGTFTMSIVCHLVPGEAFPQVGTPVDVTFSAIHIVFTQ